MKISFNWVKQFISIDEDQNEFAALLTDLGLEVEGISNYSSIKGGLEGVIVGKVLKCEKHPNADTLKLTSVDIGDDCPLPIVCGAPNVTTGQKVAVATIGTKLYDKDGQEWLIKKGKIRGQESLGMLCAEDELGLGNAHDGIMVLDPKIQVGTPASKIFEIENDVVFDIGLTPNRADAMSHWGVARDLKAGYLQRNKNLELITPSVSSFRIDRRSRKILVEVENPKLCPRYCGLSISGVSIKPSPTWISNRLLAIGITPKNNVVDISNYVLHELGQPLHAFDADQIQGNQIRVKTLPKNTPFTTLDGIDRKLHPEDLMICDNLSNPLCLAGIFGGLHSGVSEKTTTIFLESAYFDPISIRKSAKRHGLSTDASYRFERGIDPKITEYALKRAALLITKYAGGEITSDVSDSYPNKIEDFQVFISYEKVEKILGERIAEDTIKDILTSLEIKINSLTEAGLGLTIPAYRNDVTREADVIEEILRIYGYNRIGFSKKLNASIAIPEKYSDHEVQNQISSLLVNQGFFETMSNSLTNPNYSKLNPNSQADTAVSIINPLSSELSVLRQEMIFSGLETISHNINRKSKNLKIFEFGKIYHKTLDSYREQKQLGILITGLKTKENWTSAKQPTNFFYLKAIVQAILTKLGIQNYNSEPVTEATFSEGLDIYLKKKKLVSYGKVTQTVLDGFSIQQEVWHAVLDWNAIMACIPKKAVTCTQLPKFPSVRRDFALLIDKSVSFSDIYTLALKTEKRILKSVDLFDVYEGGKLPEGKKSYAVSFILQDQNKTLTDKQIDKIMRKLQHSFQTHLHAELR